MSKKMAGDDVSMFHDGSNVIFVEFGIKPLLSWSSLKSTGRNMTYNEHLGKYDFPIKIKRTKMHIMRLIKTRKKRVATRSCWFFSNSPTDCANAGTTDWRTYTLMDLLTDGPTE